MTSIESPARRVLLLLGLLSTAGVGAAGAQVKASEPAMVSQTVDGTKITIEYSRPRSRGRDTLFGKAVPWGEVWTPGANYATTIEVDKDVTIEGRPLPKGKYTVWMQVQPGDWTMVIDTTDRLFHMQHPKVDPSQIRWTFRPGTGPFTDVLTWEFDRIRVDGTTLVMRWGTVRVPLEIRVQPSYDLAFDRAKAGPYLGTWEIRSEPGMSPDTTPGRMEVAHRDGRLVATLEPPMFDMEEYRTMVLVPKREHWFVPAFWYQGEVYEMWDDVLVDFEVKDGRSENLAFRGLRDEVFGRGKRIE